MPRGRDRDPSLPPPREISDRLFASNETETADDDSNSLFLWSFGQFLDHDLTFTPTMGEILRFNCSAVALCRIFFLFLAHLS